MLVFRPSAVSSGTLDAPAKGRCDPLPIDCQVQSKESKSISPSLVVSLACVAVSPLSASSISSTSAMSLSLSGGLEPGPAEHQTSRWRRCEAPFMRTRLAWPPRALLLVHVPPPPSMRSMSATRSARPRCLTTTALSRGSSPMLTVFSSAGLGKGSRMAQGGR